MTERDEINHTRQILDIAMMIDADDWRKRIRRIVGWTTFVLVIFYVLATG